jgi:hypothetical protein
MYTTSLELPCTVRKVSSFDLVQPVCPLEELFSMIISRMPIGDPSEQNDSCCESSVHRQ